MKIENGEIRGNTKEMEDVIERTIENLEREISIDLYNLQEECAKHSELFFQAARVFSSANILCNQSDLKLKEKKAEIATMIRNNPEKFGITKITESQIEETILQQDEIKSLQNIRIRFLEQKNLTAALVTAFEHRRSMLNNEVQLSLSGLAEPDRQARREMTEREIVRRKIIKKATNEKDS